jgi:tetratricopeptide (TPR) repeat protein
MKRLVALMFIVTAASAAFAETSIASSEVKPSPAERTIAQAQRLIEKNPKDFEAYNSLALALSRRARETSDVNYYVQAEEALQKSFAISPDNFDGARTHVWLLLGKHDFAAALEEAKKLNKRMPDDVMTYAFLTDANVELGNYSDAENSAQMMLDLRPGNLPALTRAAYLRELFGDIDGAMELMNIALQSTAPSEVEDAAWILSQMAHLELALSKTTEAEKYLRQALTLFPDYHYALGNLAKVRIHQKRYE